MVADVAATPYYFYYFQGVAESAAAFLLISGVSGLLLNRRRSDTLSHLSNSCPLRPLQVFQIALASMEMHAMRTLGDDELVQFRAFQQAQAATQQQQQHHQAYPYPQQVPMYQPVPMYSPASTAVPIYAGAASGSGYQTAATLQPDDPSPSAAFKA